MSVYPFNCLARKIEGLSSTSRAGSLRKFDRKVEQTCVMVALTVLLVSSFLLVLPHLFRLQAAAKAQRMCVRCDLLNLSSHSSSIPTVSKNLRHLSKLPTCFWWVARAIPACWSRRAREIESRRPCLSEAGRSESSLESVEE